MKGQTRFPLWLICDVAAAIRLALATWLLSYCVRRYWPKHAKKQPTPEGIASISLALSCAEALLRWAIVRQAMRACGLDPRTVRLFQLPQATSSFTWQARCRTFLRLIENMTLYARRWAKRIKAALAARPPRPSAAAAAFEISPAAARVISLCAAVPAGQRIRAPPWLLANSTNTSPAPCRSIGEVAGVCAST